MRRICTLLLALAALSLVSASAQARSLKGEWRATEFAEYNKVDEWKMICGVRPPGHKRLPKGPHKIKMFKKEFNIFRGSERVLSTYLCNSPNKAVKKIKSRLTELMRRELETCNQRLGVNS